MNHNSTAPAPARRLAERGFTLVEVMVVIVILGLIATIVTTSITSSSDEAKVNLTKNQILEIKKTIDVFYAKNSRMPRDWDELIQRDEQGARYLDANEPPLDAWDRELLLQPGEYRNQIIIKSVGPDGQEGTEDDIDSENARSRKRRD